MLVDPNRMEEFKGQRKKVSLRQRPLPKFESAAQTFFRKQKTPKKRK